jgi:hypothetical protein
MKTREEHLAWCKERALEYADRGDLKNAVASMGSDLNKHPETAASSKGPLLLLGMKHVIDEDAVGVRRWIEGFN